VITGRLRLGDPYRPCLPSARNFAVLHNATFVRPLRFAGEKMA